MIKRKILWERHCHWASRNMGSMSPSIPSEVVEIRVILGRQIPANNCHSDVKAQLLPKMIKPENVRRGRNGVFLRCHRTEGVIRMAVANIGDCPGNGLGAVEPVQLDGRVVEVYWFRC